MTRADGKRLTKAQLSALRKIEHQGRGSPYSTKASVATFMALEKKKLIVVETTFDSIAFPRNAHATITDSGRLALTEGKNDE